MTTLLLGASGQLGSALARLIEDAVTPTHEEFDLATLTPGRARELLESVAPDVLINSAAWTAVDAAEDHEEEATRVNGTAVSLLAECADQAEIPFVTYSTDYVFDGNGTSPYGENDPTDPINAYGRSKLVGENAALEFPQSLVIRTSWVQSATHKCFIRTMIQLAQERDELRVVDDQFGRPTFAEDLARATLDALGVGASGLLHVANAGETNWYEFAAETLDIADLKTRVVPVPSSEYETLAERPMYSVLDTRRMQELGLPAMPPWQETLQSSVAAIMRMYQ